MSCRGFVFAAYEKYIITTLFDDVLHINVSVQHNGGLLPDIILLTQGHYHRG